MSESGASCNFFSNYTHVIVCLADNPNARLRDLADHVGITERAAFWPVTELEAADIIERIKAGLRNNYFINVDAHLRHRLKSHCTVGERIATILDEPVPQSQRARALGTER